MFVSSDYPPRTGGLDVDGFRLLVIKVPTQENGRKAEAYVEDMASADPVSGSVNIQKIHSCASGNVQGHVVCKEAALIRNIPQLHANTTLLAHSRNHSLSSS
ncbi:hypothetical protein BGW80DRAFT_1309260 [Lactifluus volemus]|nr:hypothetical protein BGW80DRAFT_1309260 [Lactifluus volemus]